MGPALCKDKNKSTRICCSCSARCGGGCATANFLLLPSFHLKIRLAAFQLFAESLLLLLLPLLSLPGKDLQINFPLKLTWYQTGYQQFSARARAGAGGAGRRGQGADLCLAGRRCGRCPGWQGCRGAGSEPDTDLPVLAFLLPLCRCSSPA